MRTKTQLINSEHKDKEKHSFKLRSTLLSLCMLTFIGGYSQTGQVNLNLKNASVKEFFKAIEKQTNYRFSYRDAEVNGKRGVTILTNGKALKQVLVEELAKQGLDYTVSGNKIIIFPAKKTVASTKEQRVKGKIIDSNGEPMIGATIKEKGTSNGVITDLNGNFAFNVSANAVLEVSFVGYQTKELKAAFGKDMVITLSEDTQTLDEVVVVGYGVQKKANLSGAVASVATKQLENRPVLNVGQALQGTVANLNVEIGTGQAISTPSFNVRGYESINGGSPLIVIDGVASDAGMLNRMNPNDIASISVLKDASSCAIYGAKAAYGVILVTTKEAKNEKLTINYNNNFSFRSNTFSPEIITDPYTVATMRNQAYYPWGTIYNEESLEYAKKMSENPGSDPYRLTPNGTYEYWGQTDWVDECYKNFSFATNHSVDLSGRTDKLDYYFSAGYNYQNGMIKYNTDTYNRYTINSKLNFHIKDWWSVSNNTSVITYDYKAPTNLSSDTYWAINRISPLDMPKNPDGTWTSSGANPLGLLAEGGDWEKYETQIRTTFGTRIDLLKDVLWVQGSLSYSTNKNRQRWAYLPVAYTDGPDRPIKYQNEVTSAYADSGDDKDIYIDIYATFHKTFAQKHDLTAMIGFNQEKYEYYGNNLDRKDLISTSVPTAGLATGDMNVGESLGSKATRSGFGRIGYIYDNKYIIEFNGRYDGTSSFPKDDRFVFNPSASLGWVISKEKFFEPLTSTISFLKFRASYGQLGNQDVGYYPYLATMGNGKISAIIEGKQPVYVGTPGLVSGSLTWEKVKTLNVGADLNFFENRLSFTGEYYVRRTEDMLTHGATLPGVLGTDVPYANAADLKTRGWELTVGYKDRFTVAGKPLNIGVSFNIADSRTFITKFDNPNGNLSDWYEGCEVGEMWGLTTLGFFKDEEDIKNHADQTPVTSYPGTPPTAPGDLKFADLDGDGIINSGAWTLEDHGDYTVIGNSRSRYTYGISLNADWNSFDFSVFLQGVGKKDYYPGASDLYFWGIYNQPWTNITYGNMYDHWSEDNPDGYFPRLKSYVAFQGGLEAAATQTKYLQNAAYLRLKNLQLGYTFPKKWVEKIGLSYLRLFFTGDNLAVWSGLYKHYKCDPEGLAGSGYPLQRAYSFGMNVTF